MMHGQQRPPTCPVCLGANGAKCRVTALNRDAHHYACEACGQFELTETALVNWFDSRRVWLTPRQRAALSHWLRTADPSGGIVLTSDWMERFSVDANLPDVPMQAINVIRLIGDYLSETGEGYVFNDLVDHIRVGTFNATLLRDLLEELESAGVLKQLSQGHMPNRDGQSVSVSAYGLTLRGWEKYTEERQGKLAGRYGFIAMKFNEHVLDALVRSTIKPRVKAAIGYDVVDSRDKSRAGVIDNIMREQIRDAAFVLVDLTHDNSGAYWEAGYAEGLGKPVIYLCERRKFDETKTHFDTNHCTTVIWSEDNPDAFGEELVATLRRSLQLFPST